MFKLKKIEAILLMIPMLMILMLPIASAEITADTYIAHVENRRYYFVNNNVIQDIDSSSYPQTSGSSFTHTWDYVDAYGYDAIQLFFEFPESKYVLGQTYELKFDVSTNQNYIYSYFFPNAIPLSFTNEFFSVGDTYLPNRLNSLFLSSLSDAQKTDMQTYQFSKVRSVSIPISIPADYMSDLVSVAPNAQKIIPVYIYAAFYSGETFPINSVTYSNIRLIPTGATQYLYSDKVYQENVENELSDINQGLEEQNSQLQDANNKLDDILDQPEEERSEALQESNDAVNGIINGIDDKGPGFFNAIQGLVQALSYNGTEAKWNFPEVKLPKIEGAWEELVLIQSQEIDFNFWFDRIPELIINLARAFSTILLVIFCFRELYSTIQYVMTLRGGG